MRSYKWIFVLMALLTLAVGVRFGSMVMESRSHPRQGDGKFPSTYGFDLENLTIPRDQLTASPLPKDALDALTFPEIYSAEKARAFRGRSKYIVPSDLVIGVSVNGHARAYPLQVLNWHEVVNDTLGGVPVVVSYTPWAGEASAHDRRLGGAETTPRLFGVSGLLWNSHHLLYDRQESDAPAGEETLFSPLTGGSIAGPGVDRHERLQPIPSALVPWDLWVSRFPETTVIGRDEMQIARYGRKPYSNYFGNDELRFPVSPLPVRDGRKWKSPVIALTDDSAQGSTKSDGVFFVSELIEQAKTTGATDGYIDVVVEGSPVRFFLSERPPAVLPLRRDTGELVAHRTAFWFAWYSIHPGGIIR